MTGRIHCAKASGAKILNYRVFACEIRGFHTLHTSILGLGKVPFAHTKIRATFSKNNLPINIWLASCRHGDGTG